LPLVRLHLSSPFFPYTTLFRSSGTHLVRPPRASRVRIDPRSPLRFGTSAGGKAAEHDAERQHYGRHAEGSEARRIGVLHVPLQLDRKSTRLNSSHVKISYAVFC